MSRISQEQLEMKSENNTKVNKVTCDQLSSDLRGPRRRRHRRGGRSKPRDWLYCPKSADYLICQKFFAFKTPLNCQSLPNDLNFTVDDVFHTAERKGIKLGLWIDLTNTTKYYCKHEVMRHSCYYVKLPCQGHITGPSINQIKFFIHTCNSFIASYPNFAIGVHCTHGMNRTGSLIVSYLIECLGYHLIGALREFSRARPPGIYKEVYLRDLCHRYGRQYSPQSLLPPVVPHWVEK